MNRVSHPYIRPYCLAKLLQLILQGEGGYADTSQYIIKERDTLAISMSLSLYVLM